MSVIVSTLGYFALISGLYGLKIFLFRRVHQPRVVFCLFILGVCLALPITWLLSPDWDNQWVQRIGIWVGEPIGALTVPCVSFLYDYFSGQREIGRWYVRVPVEILILIPVWAFIWVQIMCWILGWVGP